MSKPLQAWTVDIREHGRCGSVIYHEPAGSLSMSWEFGGGETVASVHAGDEATWRRDHPWAVEHRPEILQRVAQEVLRVKAPGCHAEIDAQGGWIHIREGAATPPTPARRPPPMPSPPQARPHPSSPALAFLTARRRLTFLAALVLLAASLAIAGMKSLFSIRVPHGIPLGESVRTPREIATLIRTLEPYVPSLNRNPEKDRYRVSLFLYPVDGSSAGRRIPLAGDLRGTEADWAKLLGSDGRTVWFRLNDLGGVELDTGKRLGPAELRAANPTLPESWDDPRRITFGQRLQITLSDRSIHEVDPGTLKASPLPRDRASVAPMGTPQAQDFLCAEVRPSPTEWLGVHTPEEAAQHYRPKSRLAGTQGQPYAKVPRRLHRGQLGPEQDRGRREILSLDPLSDDLYVNAAFVRSGRGASPLDLPEPPGYLLTFASGAGSDATLVVARMDAQGTLAWKTNTGIDRFKLSQILPDSRFTAFVGTRPPVPGKVPEPILVIVDTRSGSLATCSLWQ